MMHHTVRRFEIERGLKGHTVESPCVEGVFTASSQASTCYGQLSEAEIRQEADLPPAITINRIAAILLIVIAAILLIVIAAILLIVIAAILLSFRQEESTR